MYTHTHTLLLLFSQFYFTYIILYNLLDTYTSPTTPLSPAIPIPSLIPILLTPVRVRVRVLASV